MDISLITDLRITLTSGIFLGFVQGERKLRYDCGCKMTYEAFGIIVGERVRERLAPQGKIFTIRNAWQNIVAFHHPNSKTETCQFGYASADMCGLCLVESLKQGVIDCCMCAEDIVPGDGVVFHKKPAKENLTRSTTAHAAKRLMYIGCVRSSCTTSNADAVWTGNGFGPAAPQHRPKEAKKERESARP